MSEEMKGTNISSPVVPFTKDDRYATHDEEFGRGGYRSVASVAEMNAIPTERRKEGMLVNVIGDKIYKLVGSSFVPSFKTINGQSILGSGNITISGSSGSSEPSFSVVDDTKLCFSKIKNGDLLTSAQQEELVRIIFGQRSTFFRIHEKTDDNRDYFSTILDIYSGTDGLAHFLLYGVDGELYDYSVNASAGVGKASWTVNKAYDGEKVFNIDSSILNFSNIKSRADKTATEEEFIYVNDILAAAYLEKNIFRYNYIDEATGALGCSASVDFSATTSDMNENLVYLNFSLLNGDTPELYRLVMDNSSTASDANKWEVYTQSLKPDLNIDVKTGNKNGVSTIYYRIREVVPNGYIQFVRKKKTTYKTPTANYKQSRYSVKDLSVHSISGVEASTLQPNVWYEFPISKDDLVSTYARGSLDANGVARTYDMFKFKGNTHANPILYSNMGMAGKYTMVLHAGLQYNVLEDTFVKGTSANPIFKQRGEVVPIDVRLKIINTSSIAAGFKLIFAVQ